MIRFSRFSAVILAVGLIAACNSEVVETESRTVVEQPAVETTVAEATPNGPLEPVVEADAASVPAPIDLPQFEARKNLMRAMGGAGRRVGSSNMDEAREAATQIGEYSLAARHPRFQPEGPEYDAFAIELWRRNQEVQLAMAPDGDRSLLQQALRGQRDACQACHTAYRIEED